MSLRAKQKSCKEVKFPKVRAWVAELRARSGLTLVEISNRAGVDYGLLRKWSSGVNKPEWENTIALEHLRQKHVPVVELQADSRTDGVPSATMTAKDDFEVMLLERFRALTPAQRLNLLHSMESKPTQHPAAPTKG